MKKFIFFGIFLIAIIIFSAMSIFILNKISVPLDIEENEIKNFEDCLNRGFDVILSSPPKCMSKDGTIFVKDVEEEKEIPSEEKPIKEPEKKCIITGCSSHICSEFDIITTCEFLPEYDCYKDAICKTLDDGECGWVMTKELKECIDQLKKD